MGAERAGQWQPPAAAQTLSPVYNPLCGCECMGTNVHGSVGWLCTDTDSGVSVVGVSMLEDSLKVVRVLADMHVYAWKRVHVCVYMYRYTKAMSL